MMPIGNLEVLCVGTADTKLEELQFLSQSLRYSLQIFSSNSSSKVLVTVVDVSASPKDVKSCGDFKFVSRSEVLSSSTTSTTLLPDDRGKAIAVMNKALESFLCKIHLDGVLAGVIGLGGSGGTSIMSSAFRSLPIGIPKVIVSTVASGHTEPYIGTSDLVLFPSVVDICGINSVSRSVLSNAAAAFAGMVVGNLNTFKASAVDTDKKPTVGITMFGVTTPCVNAVKDRLAQQGFETLVFHATGVGGRAMEDLVKGGFIQGVLDITTTEVADYIVGGVMACESSRFDAILEKKIPLVLSVGALDMVNFGPKVTIPSNFQQRKIYEHNKQVIVCSHLIFYVLVLSFDMVNNYPHVSCLSFDIIVTRNNILLDHGYGEIRDYCWLPENIDSQSGFLDVFLAQGWSGRPSHNLNVVLGLQC